MELTTAQLATLKTDINSGVNASALSVAIASRDGDFIAGFYNTDASPAFTVWKTNVTQDEIMQNGFDWTRVDNLSLGKARIWEWMFNNQARAFNPSKANVRAGIDATWVGTIPDLNVRAAVYGHCKRFATLIEKLFATGTGTDAVPATMSFSGEVTGPQILAAMDS